MERVFDQNHDHRRDVDLHVYAVVGYQRCGQDLFARWEGAELKNRQVSVFACTENDIDIYYIADDNGGELQIEPRGGDFSLIVGVKDILAVLKENGICQP